VGVGNHTIRRFLPAAPALSRVRALMFPLDLIDRLLCMPYQEFRALPPNRLRIRAGGGNRLLFNAAQFRNFPIAFWLDALERGLVRLDSSIVDLGCGCGRFALTVRDLFFHDRRFTGQYFGVDVDDEMLDWCKAHFPVEHFSFHKVDTYSRTYNPRAATQSVSLPIGTGQKQGVVIEPKPLPQSIPSCLDLPLTTSSVDFAFANSLFSHLLEKEFREYLREAARVLRSGGYMQFSVFCIEHADLSLGSRLSFKHRLGPAHIENEKYPEAAVAYELAWLKDTCLDAGFSHVEVLPSSGQTMMRCRK
jgi:SAM-dependent methyltransferase